MDEQGLADHIANDPGDNLDWVVCRPEFEQPWSRAARTSELKMITVQPDDEDLRLDRTLDIEAVRVSGHDEMVRREAGARATQVAPYGLQPGH
jgi:hypothetical protein